MIRVAIVDDHPVVREGIAANLRAYDDIEVVASGATAGDAVNLARSGIADAIVLDLELPDRNGLEIIADLKNAQPAPAVIVFSAYAGEERVMRAFESGADSYVLKGTPSDELIAVLRTVRFGGSVRIPEDIATQLARAARRPRAGRLTEREREILNYVAEGLSNRSIAERAGISERTVKFHVSGILARLGAASRAEALAIARSRGMI